MTGFSICCAGCIEAAFGAQVLELVEGGLFLCSEMTEMTFQPCLCFGSFWGWRADGTTTLIASEFVHSVVIKAVDVSMGTRSKVAGFMYVGGRE